MSLHTGLKIDDTHPEFLTGQPARFDLSDTISQKKPFADTQGRKMIRLLAKEKWCCDRATD